jgi:amino-acid N-acetyltransferase
MTANVEIRLATTSDLAAAETWLSQAGLPTEDLTSEHMQRFLIATVNDVPVGMVGLEAFGGAGLLRSLFVDESGRGRGVGAQLVAALENMAASSGIDELWLLTIDADSYFAALGYESRFRAEAPESIRNTQEFSALCPGDAVLMSKGLQERL